MKRLMGVLPHREKIAEHLGRMPFVRQSIKHRDTGVCGKLFHRPLREAAVLERVIHFTEHPGRVLHAFLVSELRRRGVKERRVCALVRRRDLKGASGPGRGLLKNQRDIFPDETRHFVPAPLRALQIFREIEKIGDFFRRMVAEA